MNTSRQFLLSVYCMMKWSTLMINIPWWPPLRFYFKVHCDHNATGARAMTKRSWGQGGYKIWSEEGLRYPICTICDISHDPIHHPPCNEKAFISNQWAVSHFMTCHNDNSPGNNRDAHFKLMKQCSLVHSQGDCSQKHPNPSEIL